MSLLHAAISYRVLKIGSYIRGALWPYLQERAAGAPSWEGYIQELGHRPGWVLQALVIDGPTTGLFVMASLAAVVFVEHVNIWLRLVAILLTAVAIAAPLVASALASQLLSSGGRE